MLSSAGDVVGACIRAYLPVLERAPLAVALAFEPSLDPEQALVGRERVLHEQKALESLAQGGRTVVRIPEWLLPPQPPRRTAPWPQVWR